MAKRILTFPKGFLWGTATSAYQVEGGIENNDWVKDYPAGKACDQYNRYEEDFDLAKSMYNNAHRLSLEWSRIEPEEGKFDQEEIEHYREVLQALRVRGLEPFVTLHHFTNPVWFSKQGGWINKKSPEYFERYTRKIVDELGDLIVYWITINEPIIYVHMGYLHPIFPPQHNRDFIGTFRVISSMIKGHKRAYEVIKQSYPNSFVGMAKNNGFIDPYKNRPWNWIIARVFRYMRNEYVLDRIKNYQDFIGVNHYFHALVRINFTTLPWRWFRNSKPKEVSDFGWEIYPESLYHVAKQVYQRYGKPIYITENGISDADDDQRPSFLTRYLSNLHKAIEEGADVRGYFYWSDTDAS